MDNQHQHQPQYPPWLQQGLGFASKVTHQFQQLAAKLHPATATAQTPSFASLSSWGPISNFYMGQQQQEQTRGDTHILPSSPSGSFQPVTRVGPTSGAANIPADMASAWNGLSVSSSPISQKLSDSRKAELGRATWTLLHMLAAQFPDQPTRQQQRDARNLIESLTRIYPCADCAGHFQQIVRKDPPKVSNGPEFRQWVCRVHNVVNRSIDKPSFNCDFVDSRWAPLECESSSCDLTVGKRK